MAYYPGQQPAYGQQPVVIQQQDNIPQPSVWGQSSSVQIRCPSCKGNHMTRTSCTITGMQWLICIILFLIACPYPCLPCYIPSCYRVSHHCSGCNHFIGVSQ